MSQIHRFLDQSDHKHSYHPPVHSAHPDLVNPECSGQKKIFSLGTPGAVDTVTYKTITEVKSVTISLKFGQKITQHISTIHQKTQHTLILSIQNSLGKRKFVIVFSLGTPGAVDTVTYI